MMQVQFSPTAWDEYLSWQVQDKRVLKCINALLKDIQRQPYDGIGKPEALKGNLSSFWSRRIDEEHRLVYRVVGDVCEIAQCKGYYEDR